MPYRWLWRWRCYPYEDSEGREVMTIYVVSPLAQKVEVDKHCFGDCGKILVGGIEVAGAPFFPCRTNPCPYEEKTLEFGTVLFELGTEQIFVRKLKKEQKP